MQLTPFKDKPKPREDKPRGFEIYWTRRRMWIAVTWSMMVASAAVAYYFFLFLPEQHRITLEYRKEEQELRERLEKARLEQEQSFREDAAQEKRDEALRLDSCLSDAEHNYVAGWDRECYDRNEGRDCRLPNETAAQLNEQFKEARGECFKRYKEA